MTPSTLHVYEVVIDREQFNVVASSIQSAVLGATEYFEKKYSNPTNDDATSVKRTVIVHIVNESDLS